MKKDNLKLKRIRKEDMEQLFVWANDPVTRAASFNTEPISYENHVKWFEKKLHDSDCHFYMAYVDNMACGSIRFDIENDYEIDSCGKTVAVISYSIAPEYRGRGLGKEIIAKGCEMMHEKLGECILVGEVKTDNIYSHKCFEANGFDILIKKANETAYYKSV